jgi:lipopolysaccharide biosynthesis glycosyltransferase
MINVAIGTEPRTEIARKVLQFSIVKHTNKKINFISLFGNDQYDRGELNQSTGFSLLRFSIPELLGYKGSCIYLDADMLFLSDINKLWKLTDDKKSFVWTCYGNTKKEIPETSLMVFNCEMAKGKIKTMKEIEEYLKNDDEGRTKYKTIMTLGYLKEKPTKLDKYYNVMDKGNVYTSLNDFRSPNVKNLHYTSVQNQPWFKPTHPAADIWGNWLKLSIKDGIVSVGEVKDAVKKYDVSNPRRPNGLHPHWEKFVVDK